MKMKDLSITESLDLNAKEIYRTYKADKIKNANVIIDLFKELEGNDVNKSRKTLSVLQRIFCQLIKDGDIKDLTSKQKGESSPKTKYYQWLYERYIEFHEQLLNMALDKKVPPGLQEMCVLVIIKLIQKETSFPATRENFHTINFPLGKLKALYERLLFSDTSTAPLIKKLKEYLQSPDFLLVSLHVLGEIVVRVKEEEAPSWFLKNLMCLLELITLPEKGKKPLDLPVLFVTNVQDQKLAEDEDTDQPNFDFPHKKGIQIFNVIWETVLRFKFDSSTYKRCLVLMPEKVMKHLEQPVRLTDFFMNAYCLGGVTSILALHGMYILITQYNLDKPDFYEKLYLLFDTQIFHVKYKSRFFMLCNKFFLSPYLPEYIIAAFIKRCCRLMLTAPSCCLILLLKFVVNLLLRYPSLKRLIDSPNATSINDDPFLADQPYPSLCRAGDSSLWEVAALRHHPISGVTRAANFIFKNLPDVEHDLSKHVEMTYEKMYERASKIKMARIETTFHQPEGLFNYPDDTMSSSWEIF